MCAALRAGILSSLLVFLGLGDWPDFAILNVAERDDSRPRVAGLFAGIGGFELAFSQAGFEATLLAEKDPAARGVLAAHFPCVPIANDVMDLVTIPGGTAVLAAGFPCQNLSMAGDKAGISGGQSGTVERLLEIVQVADVPVVVLENVYFMLQLAGGAAMEWIATHFEALGYHWAYRVLDTAGFGLPQRRRRVYFVATKGRDPREILFADEQQRGATPVPSLANPLGFYWTEGRTGIGLTPDGIPPLKIGSALGIPSAPAVLFPDGEVLMPSLSSCQQLQGFPADWLVAHHGEGRRDPRWRMIGNAVSVPVAKWIATRIRTPGAVAEFPIEPLIQKGRWPDAAWNVGRGRTKVGASDRPLRQTPPSISEFRNSEWTRLSDRALKGFIGRLEAGNLSTPQGFLSAIKRAPRKEGVPSLQAL